MSLLKPRLKVLFPDFVWRVNQKFLILVIFVLIWWQTDKKTRNTEAKLQGAVFFDKTANCLINYQIR